MKTIGPLMLLAAASAAGVASLPTGEGHVVARAKHAALGNSTVVPIGNTTVPVVTGKPNANTKNNSTKVAARAAPAPPKVVKGKTNSTSSSVPSSYRNNSSSSSSSNSTLGHVGGLSKSLQ